MGKVRITRRESLRSGVDILEIYTPGSIFKNYKREFVFRVERPRTTYYGTPYTSLGEWRWAHTQKGVEDSDTLFAINKFLNEEIILKRTLDDHKKGKEELELAGIRVWDCFGGDWMLSQRPNSPKPTTPKPKVTRKKVKKCK